MHKRGYPLAIFAAITALVIGCTATSTDSPAAARAGTAALAAPKPVGVVMTSAPTLIATPARHSAFPGLVAEPGGRLELVWRGATDHVNSRDGAIWRATSTDLGRTYTFMRQVASGRDYRDPYLAYIDGREYLTYFTGSAQLAAEGAMVSRDGAPAVRVDTLPYAAISGPIVKLPDGRLGAAFYGRKAGEAYDTAWMGWSSDIGATWTTNRIINSGIATPEPWLVVDGSQVHMFARWGSDKIAVRTSADSGATWGGVRVIIDGCTGRPSTMRTAAGTLIMICRGPVSQGNHAKLLYSLDHAGYWIVGPTLLTAAPGTLGMTYAAMTEVLPGVVHAVIGMEHLDGSSDLYGVYLAESIA
jgi:hypothetical protein